MFSRKLGHPLEFSKGRNESSKFFLKSLLFLIHSLRTLIKIPNLEIFPENFQAFMFYSIVVLILFFTHFLLNTIRF